MNDYNKPFRLTLEHYDVKISVERDRSDLELTEVIDMLKTLLAGAGFSTKQIDEYIDHE